jgi:flagellar hook assembly protein FlgD
LTVFDLLGREVRTIVNRHLAAGTHTVQWDGKDNQGRQVPAGIYFCELAAGQQRSMKRMVFLPR